MFSFGAGEGAVMQSAWVTPNLSGSIDRWARALKVGPWFRFDHFKLDWMTYRGRPSDIDISIALAWSGGIFIELIEQHDDAPSVYRDMHPKGVEAFHHVAIATSDYRGTISSLERSGASLIVDGKVAVGAHAGYADTRALIGAYTEIIEVTPAVETLFEMIRDAAVNWDRSDPVRHVA
jgi:hypothetical protein